MKKMLLPMLALVVAVSLSAFTHKGNYKATATDNWYEYQGPLPGTADDLKEESNYSKLDDDPECGSNQLLCAVHVPGTGDHPDEFSQAIESSIVNAVSSKTPVEGSIEMRSE